MVLQNLATGEQSPRRHQRRPSSSMDAKLFMNIDEQHDLGIENLLSKELNQRSSSPRVYIHKLNECFQSEDIY